jgi:hypothetical protein
MNNWITDREPTIKDGDLNGNVITVGYNGDVIIERFNQVNKGMPWLPTPVPPRRPSTRWTYGSQPNFLTDGEYTVIVSGGEGKRERDKVVKVVLETLNMELP